jgi:TolA-binding protein
VRWASLIALAACSAPAPLPELVSAERLESEGQTDGALAAYREAQITCQKLHPARVRTDTCSRALVGEAELLEDAGRTKEAIAAWAAIPEKSNGDPPPSAQGLYRAGMLTLQEGDAKVAWTYLWKTVTDFPDEAFAGDAVRALLRDGRTRDARALYEVMKQTEVALEDTQVADNLLWSMADLAEHELNDPQLARSLYDRIDEEHADSGLRDDAYWYAANLSRSMHDPKGAVTRLRALLATREVARLVGSYFSVWLDDGQLLLGQILRDDLRDYDGAIAAFRQLPKDYPASILQDDASYELAVTLAQKGDWQGSCAELARLAKTWPDSKYELELAPALATAQHCPSP